jgi:hypothetical protein
MLQPSKNLALGAVCLVVVACLTSVAVLITRASSDALSPAAHTSAISWQVNKGRRNLSLQPEAFRVARQLGKRFGAASRAVSTSSGQLSVAGTQQAVTITRRQAEGGETVELSLANRVLTWNADEGTKASTGAPTENERLLLERLLLDSPDNFVLAQLRGASYFVVARNVRPVDAIDGYDGPLWNLVRVDEPQVEGKLRPLSTWRMYYLNVQTDLPDRVEYQLEGKEIIAEFLEWKETQGEKTPSRIRWLSDGQLLMEYDATSVSLNQ